MFKNKELQIHAWLVFLCSKDNAEFSCLAVASLCSNVWTRCTCPSNVLQRRVCLAVASLCSKSWNILHHPSHGLLKSYIQTAISSSFSAYQKLILRADASKDNMLWHKFADCVAFLFIYHTLFFLDFGIHQNGLLALPCLPSSLPSKTIPAGRCLKRFKKQVHVSVDCVVFLRKYYTLFFLKFGIYQNIKITSWCLFFSLPSKSA